ncbi:hypothetical protein [Fluviicola sp.]|uniref:hypothetical protein n=1 Tax=Fluviicola sp. TaxID=1917219 RepID=UPI002606C51E|nr:hypothetical protein [Fluviicola sp.]
MKKLIFLGLIMLAGPTLNTFAQDSDSTGMPGDNFDLQGALQLFKQSSTLEEFEKKLNTESNAVNNLDLNGDNAIDYIRVIDKKEGDNHAILLQIPVNSKENQDVAAIVIEKRSNSEAQLQIIGNETLYGEEKIMEPTEEQAVKQTGPSAYSSAPPVFVFVNVWGWPCVQYIYDPWHSPWYSPYYWDYYPVWWRPWRPLYWNVYYQRVYHYHGWCSYTNFYHVPYAHNIYKNNSTNSAYVKGRTEPQRVAYKNRVVTGQSSANGSQGRVNPNKTGTIGNETKPQPLGRTDEMRKDPGVVRPTVTNTNPEQRTPVVREQQAPRPINPNNGGVMNGGRTNDGNIRTTDPGGRTPAPVANPQQRPMERVPRVDPQPRPVEQRNPERIQPMPQQREQAPVFRQPTPGREISRPANGGGGGGRMQRR